MESGEDATARGYIAAYKDIRATVQLGQLYRLLSPQERAPQSATESVAADGRQAVLFAFLRQGQEAQAYPTLYLQGLDESARYRYRLIHGKAVTGTPETASGAYWMHHGIDLTCTMTWMPQRWCSNGSGAGQQRPLVSSTCQSAAPGDGRCFLWLFAEVLRIE